MRPLQLFLEWFTLAYENINILWNQKLFVICYIDSVLAGSIFGIACACAYCMWPGMRTWHSDDQAPHIGWPLWPRHSLLSSTATRLVVLPYFSLNSHICVDSQSVSATLLISSVGLTASVVPRIYWLSTRNVDGNRSISNEYCVSLWLLWVLLN